MAEDASFSGNMMNDVVIKITDYLLDANVLIDGSDS